MSELRFWLNGEPVVLEDPDPRLLLTDFLRARGLTGTKVACGQGGCGACTVMLSHGDEHRPINACMKPVCALEGCAVTTVEGLGSVNSTLDPVQHRIAACNGTQCGFCTPGFVMNAHATLRAGQRTQQELEDQFGGNLCRCTGYRPILHAVRSFATDFEGQPTTFLTDPSLRLETHDTRPVATPPAENRSLSFRGRWFRPASLQEALQLKREHPEADWVVGNTALGIYPEEVAAQQIDLGFLAELTVREERPEGLRVGASVTIQQLLDFADAVIARRPEPETRGLRELSRHGKLIAGRQLRSAGSIAGNFMLTVRHQAEGEPFPSDLLTLLMTLGATATLHDGSTVELDALSRELILHFDIPYTTADEVVQTHRVARRAQNSHALVAAGFRATVRNGALVKLTAVYAGLGRRVERHELPVGPVDQATLDKALQQVAQLELISTEHEGVGTAYRARLARHFLFKFFLKLKGDPEGETYVRPLSHGTQDYPEHPELYPLALPILKRAAFVQASGETRYTHDLPLPTGGLHAALVRSARPHAHFTLPAEKDLRARFPGTHLITAADIPGNPLIGLGEDDQLFARDTVTSVGLRLALVCAETEAKARAAAGWVELNTTYQDLPAVLTLDEAMEQDTAMPMKRRAKDPDEDIQQRLLTVRRPGTDTDPIPHTHTVQGSLRTGAQAHFHLETMCSLAIPGDYDHMTVHSSTQNPNGDQRNIARALGVGVNQVTVQITQVGGGFGAKQHQAGHVGAAAAVAARKLNRAVRLCYDRVTDTHGVGKRHPYLGNYRLTLTPEGQLERYLVDLHSDAGDSYDCSFAVMDLSLLMAEGTYYWPQVEANGTVYRTNKTSNTAFRTFGTVQPYLVLEDALEHAAWKLKLDPEKLRRQNLYRPEHEAPYGQKMTFTTLSQIWDRLWETSDYEKRRQAVAEFNASHRWRKRGLAIHAVKYGIGFTEPRGSLNASSALVNVNFTDGSVTVIHGGVEMGQGLHTKIAQMAASALGIPLEKVRVTGNSSDVIVNAPATAASTGYDLNAGAVEKACLELRARLECFCENLEQFNPHDCILDWRTDWASKWPEITARAWFHRIGLSVAALYRSPHYEGPSAAHPRAHPFLYYVNGAAATEVEIDVLTGETVVLRADVLYDAGKSPNPAVDIGQIEGGYVQGLGMMLTEEVVFSPEGRLVTDNTWSYKPPCTKTIPVDFRVSLMPQDEELARRAVEAAYGAVRNSRTSGEPCLVLAVSAYLAVKRAIMAAHDPGEWPQIDLPATVERVQTHCQVTPEQLTL